MFDIRMLLSLLLLTLFSACYYDTRENVAPFVEATACVTDSVSYQVDIAPLMALQCNSCHNASLASGGVRVDTYDQVKAHASNGSLYGSMNHDAGYVAMPTNAGKLPACDLAKVKAWVDAGFLNN